jgi:hypothetical protein
LASIKLKQAEEKGCRGEQVIIMANCRGIPTYYIGGEGNLVKK